MKTLHSEMVGKHIKAHMKYKGVTVNELSAVIPISNDAVFKLVRGQMKASKKTMVAICKFLDLHNPLELYKAQYIKG